MSTGLSANSSIDDAVAAQWYAGHVDVYSAFTRLLHATIENLMRAATIDYLSVTSRTKSLSSFTEKLRRKEYRSPEETTDLTGIRVITFIESGAESAADVLRRSFKIHAAKSLDKSEQLGDSQVGYRSIHLICELGPDRASLPEYKPFAGLLFEVQARTALQHAWAEIDHDRSYKFNGVLPAVLRRRLNLLAGQLEMADKEFSRLAADVDSYSVELRAKTKAGDLNVEISSASVIEYLNRVAKEHNIDFVTLSSPSSFASVIDELHKFGIETVEALSELFRANFIESLKSIKGTSTQLGLLRKAMMYADIDRYFSHAWQSHWSGMTPSTLQLLNQKWGENKVKSTSETFLSKAPRRLKQPFEIEKK